MAYTPSRGVFGGREFSSRAEYRRELAKVEGHGEASYKQSYERELAREYQREYQEQQTFANIRESHIQRVLSEARQYDHAREYRYDYFSTQAVLNDRFDSHDIAMDRLGELYLQAVREDWDTRAHGAYAQLLEAAGMRDEDAEYPVGETPGGDK